jgi:hypothetical protein
MHFEQWKSSKRYRHAVSFQGLSKTRMPELRPKGAELDL